jgi:hypothetical protein
MTTFFDHLSLGHPMWIVFFYLPWVIGILMIALCVAVGIVGLMVADADVHRHSGWPSIKPTNKLPGCPVCNMPMERTKKGALRCSSPQIHKTTQIIGDL